MYRGTTPTIIFVLPFPASDLTAVSIVFAQRGQIVIEKALTDCTCEDDTITVTLTEAETLSLKHGHRVYIQLRCAVGDARLASEVIQVPVERILKEGVLV